MDDVQEFVSPEGDRVAIDWSLNPTRAAASSLENIATASKRLSTNHLSVGACFTVIVGIALSWEL